jgi:hypothetical protein
MAATAGLTPTTILPLNYEERPLQSVTVDGGAHTFSVQTIKSTDVAFVSIPAGNHSVNVVYGAPVTPTPTPTNTGLLSPTSNAAVTVNAGDNNGFGTSPANAYANDGLFAVDTNSGTNTNTSCTNNGKDKHLFYNFNVNLPGTATVQGIEVRLDGRVDSTSGSPRFCVQLSWNGGASWTTAQSTAILGTPVQTFILGSATGNWGRTWVPGDFSNTNFRVRVINVASSTARDFSLDWVAVRVTYQ